MYRRLIHLLVVLAYALGLPAARAEAGRVAGPVEDPYALTALRHLYAAAVKDEAVQMHFYQLMHGYKGRDATVVAYKAAAEAVQARYVWSPFAKLRAVRAAQEVFTLAVGLAPANVEVRFLRYTIETNVPRYLGLSGHLEEDREHIMHGARHCADFGLDTQSLRIIRDFMLLHGHCTPEETRMLRALNV